VRKPSDKASEAPSERARSRSPAPNLSDDDRCGIDPRAMLAPRRPVYDPERLVGGRGRHLSGAGSDSVFVPFRQCWRSDGGRSGAYGAGGTTGTRCWRPTAGSGAERHSGGSVDEWLWCAGPGRCPRCAGTTASATGRCQRDCPRARPTTWVAGRTSRLSRVIGYEAGIDSPGCTGICSAPPDRPGRAVDDQGWRCAARPRTMGLVRACHRGGGGWPTPSPRCAAARCRD